MKCEPVFCPKCYDKKQHVHDADQHPHGGSSCSYHWCAKCLVESSDGFGSYLDVIIYLEHYDIIQTYKTPKGYSDEHWYCENCDSFLSWDNYMDGEGRYR